jgi:hypothetical protein
VRNATTARLFRRMGATYAGASRTAAPELILTGWILVAGAIPAAAQAQEAQRGQAIASSDVVSGGPLAAR